MKILLVGMRFGNYEELIKQEFEDLGHKVILINDAPPNNTIYTRILSQKKNAQVCDTFQQKTLSSINLKEIDTVIVMVGRFLQRNFFEKIRSKNASAKFILYLWDDVIRVENYNEIKTYYDKILSFDPVDCSKYNFVFLPLFYTNEFYPSKEDKKYCIYSALSDHSDRRKIVNNIVVQSKFNSNMLFYINMGRVEYIKYYLKNMWRKKTHNECIHYMPAPIPKEKNIELMKRSEAILDIQFYGQIGLTIRTLEALGSKTKLITTNKSIKYYDFYNTNNICIIDRENPVVRQDFFETEYKSVDTSIVSKYSITSWCKAILDDTYKTYTTCKITDFEQALN